MNAAISTSNRRLVIVVLVCLSMPWFVASAMAETVTWTGGAGDGKWESGGNWSTGSPPGEGDEAIIPGNQGIITVNGKKEVQSLEVQDSPGALNKTLIQAAGPGKAVDIEATGDIEIGSDNTVRGGAGAPGKPGGNVELESTGGDVTNEGTLEGGRGGNGTSPGKGGDVKVTGNNVDNQGTENGGAGGDYTGGTTRRGGTGGNVTNSAQLEAHGGTKNGGEGGSGNPNDDAHKGRSGVTTTSGASQVSIEPGDALKGWDVRILTGATGTVLLAGISPGALDADSTISIDAGGAGTIDLTGNASGTDVMVAGHGICVHGQVQLDPGVNLGDITEPDGVESSQPCAIVIPTLSQWGLIIFSLLALSLVTVALTRRRVAVAGAGIGTGQMTTISGQLFVRTVYWKSLIATTALATVGLIAALAISGSLALRDLIGTLLGAAIVAYIAHLWIARNKEV